MARGKQSAKSNNNAFSKQMNRQPLVKPEHMGAFQQECKRVLQKLCDDKSTTIINVSDRFEKLYENMSKIQEVHKKKNSWNPQNDLVNNFTPEERVKNCEKLIEELSTTYKLDNLKNIKVVKEFEGVGLRKKMQDAEKVNDKESNLLRVPVAAMLTSDSECNGKEFEKFITNDRMTANMMNVRLALRLIYHKYDKQSDFKTYLDCLPNDYATPLYWHPNDFKCLHTGFEACNEEALTAYKFYTTIARQYLYFLTVFSGIPSLKKFYQAFTWDSYKWAVSTVQTRANQLEKNLLGFIPVIELCNTNLKSDLVVGRLFEDLEEEIKAAEKEAEKEKENQVAKTEGEKTETKKPEINPKIAMAELDISSIPNNKSIYFSYTGNANNRTSLQSLIHNALCFKEKIEVTVHLPQSKPLHYEKIAYMKSVGGDDFNKEACLSPLVKIRGSDNLKSKQFSLLQMIHFLVVALDKDPEEPEKPKEEEKKIEEIKEDDKENKKEEKPEAKVYPFNYQNEELKPKAKQFLKIRLSVLKRYLDKIEFDLFTQSVLRNYVESKRALFNELIEMVDTM